MPYSRILFYCSISFIIGISIALFFEIPYWLFLELFLLAFLYLALFFRDKNVVIFCLLLSFLCFGMCRAESFQLGQISQEGQKQSFVLEKLALLKQKAVEPIYKTLPYPESNILAGILVGQQGNIGYELKKKLSITGTSHLVAVSGMNVVLLSQTLVVLSIYSGLMRQRAILLSIFFVWFYVFLIGLPSSAVRAGIMASLLLIARALGRQNKSGRAIILSASAMLFLSPGILLSDLGFQLSFLATIGIVYLSPFFSYHFKLAIPKSPPEISKVMAETLSAEILTAPLLCYSFGGISIIAPLSNLLIVPFISIIMIAGFLLVISSFIAPFLSFLFSFFCNILMHYAVFVIDFLCKVPFAFISASFSWLFVAVCYIGIILFSFKIKKIGKEPFWC